MGSFGKDDVFACLEGELWEQKFPSDNAAAFTEVVPSRDFFLSFVQKLSRGVQLKMKNEQSKNF